MWSRIMAFVRYYVMYMCESEFEVWYEFKTRDGGKVLPIYACR